MSLPFTAAVIAYVNVASIAERLNVGIALACPRVNFYRVQFLETTSRLSDTFARFDSATYQRSMQRLKEQFDALSTVFPQASLTASDVVNQIWPDPGWNLHAYREISGITEDPEQELRDQFDYFVLSQIPAKHLSPKDRGDAIAKKLSGLLNAKFGPRVFKKELLDIGGMQFAFDFAVQTEVLNAILPVTFDLSEDVLLREKALRYVGMGQFLGTSNEIGELALYIEKPAETSGPYQHTLQLLEGGYFKNRLFFSDDDELLFEKFAPIVAKRKASGGDQPGFNLAAV
jgi:hypothetical protein